MVSSGWVTRLQCSVRLPKGEKKITNLHKLYAPCILGSDLLLCLHLENCVSCVASYKKWASQTA